MLTYGAGAPQSRRRESLRTATAAVATSRADGRDRRVDLAGRSLDVAVAARPCVALRTPRRARGAAPRRRGAVLGDRHADAAPATVGRRRRADRGRRRARARRSTGVGPSTSAPGGQRRRGRAGRRRPPGAPVSDGDARGRRQVQRGALGELAVGEPGRVPAHQRLHRRERRVGDDHDDSAVGRPGAPARPRSASGAAPPRPRAGRAARAAGRRRAAARPRTPPSATGSAPGVATTSAGLVGHGREHAVAPRRAHRRRRGNARPSSSAVRRAPTTCARKLACRRSSGTRHVGRRPAAPARTPARSAVAGRRAARRSARSAPARGSARRRATARSRGAAPGRAPGPSASASRAASQATLGSRAAARGRVARELGVVADGAHPRRARRARRAVGVERLRPAGTRPAARPRPCARARRRAAPRRSRCARSASTSRTCGYGARGSACRSSPSSQTTARPRSRTGANTAARVPTTTRAAPRRDREPAAVALGRAEVGGEHDARLRRRARRPARAASPRDVARVGDDDEHAPPGRDGRPPRPRRARAPASAPGQRRPHRARRVAAAERVEERRRRRMPGPRRREVAFAAGRCGGVGRGRRRRRLGLDPGVPRRHREAQDVGERAGVAVGDRPGQRGDLGGRAPARRETTFCSRASLPTSPCSVVGEPLEHEAVDQPPGEPHPHPRAATAASASAAGTA